MGNKTICQAGAVSSLATLLPFQLKEDNLRHLPLTQQGGLECGNQTSITPERWCMWGDGSIEAWGKVRHMTT